MSKPVIKLNPEVFMRAAINFDKAARSDIGPDAGCCWYISEAKQIVFKENYLDWNYDTEYHKLFEELFPFTKRVRMEIGGVGYPSIRYHDDYLKLWCGCGLGETSPPSVYYAREHEARILALLFCYEECLSHK